MDTRSFIIYHAFTFTIKQTDLWWCSWIDAERTNYYLPPAATTTSSSPSWTLLKPFITFSLYNSPTNPKITWSAWPRGWGLWWWQSVIWGWIPPLNNYYLPVGWESFITLWLYNCAQNTAPPPSTPNMQSSLRSLKYGLSIWRWHGWQITPRAAGTNIAQEKATHFRPGASWCNFKTDSGGTRHGRAVELSGEEAGVHLVTNLGRDCASVRFAEECPAKITPHVAPRSMSARWKGGEGGQMLGLRVDKYLTHVTLAFSNPPQPVNIFASFFVACWPW